MSIIQFNNIASVGLVKDKSPENLPSDDQNGFAWTDAQNVRFRNGAAQKMSGYSLVIDTSSTIQPTFTTRVNVNGSSYYLYAGLNNAYCYYGSVHTDITRQTSSVDVNYNASVSSPWTSCVINNFAILNNGNDTPQSWTPSPSIPKLQNLAGWGTSGGSTPTTTASVIRSYAEHLIALDITIAGTRNQNLIWWSGAALPFELPTTWDITDPTNDSAQQQISDSDGYLVDCLQLGQNNIVYKNTSTYMMQYVGFPEVFSLTKIFPNVGMLSRNCGAVFNNQHFVVTTDDVIVHNGYTYQSVIDGVNRQFLFSDMSPANYRQTFVVPNYAMGEMWICYPNNSAATYCNSVMVFNYNNNTWTRRSIPETAWISEQLIDLSSSSLWTNANYTWTNAAANVTWQDPAYSTTSWSLLMVPNNPSSSPGIYLIDKGALNEDVTTTSLGTPSTAYLERQNINLGPDESVKLIRRIWPKITLGGGNNTTIQVYVAGTMSLNQPINWGTACVFDASQDVKVDCLVSGRYIGIKFVTNSDVAWQLNSFDIDLITKGGF